MHAFLSSNNCRMKINLLFTFFSLTHRSPRGLKCYYINVYESNCFNKAINLLFFKKTR